MDRSSNIRDPVIRYIHRLVTWSIAGRCNCNERVQQIDLFYLYCILRGRPVALHRCFAEYIATYPHRNPAGEIPIGGIVTAIALRLCPGELWTHAEEHTLPRPMMPR